MTNSLTDQDPVERLVDEFASRCRGGESPTVAEYVAKHPDLAVQIEGLFPAVAMMEQLRVEERARREAAARQAASAAAPEHLGDFHILQEIGRGGMGIVYEAEQRSLGRRVAVKVLPKHPFLVDKHLRRFQREAQTAARLHHTNIVPIFGVGDQDGLHYYVMPLVRGVGLDEIIREWRIAPAAAPAGASASHAPGSPARHLTQIVQELSAHKFVPRPPAAPESASSGSPPPSLSAETSPAEESAAHAALRSDGALTLNGMQEEARHPADECVNRAQTVARLGIQAAEALSYAHGQGTLHRDIKPGNLLVDEEGVLRVADFGLARALDASDVSHSTDAVGTARYMAPEQLCGAADVRSDIYALGLTLYELLTLRPVFAAEQRAGSASEGEAHPEQLRPRKVDPSIPRDLETIVLKCLAWEPARRYQTAADLAADLRRFLEDRPIRARRASPIERSYRWCRRNPALAAMSGLAAALLLAVAATALAGHLQTRHALQHAEGTTGLALEVLDNIYAQLSPERIWIAADVDSSGEACACIGLRAGDDSISPLEQTAMRVRASAETGSLLEKLLGFYDRLAEQGGNDRRVLLQAAIATRRVGDIRLCLGQTDQAEAEYSRAVEKLTALRAAAQGDVQIGTELARTHNELGNVQSAKLDAGRACESHQAALAALESCTQSDQLPEEYRYELARTYYFLASKNRSTPNRVREADDTAPRPAAPPFETIENRRSAIRILLELTAENPHAPDYRLLLALCYRQAGAAADTGGNRRNAEGRARALHILEELTAEYPSVADYRYELIATYAWIPVSLFPWQGRFPVPQYAESNLRKAIGEASRLGNQHPEVPRYTRCQTLILAKLAALCWKTRHLDDAEKFFRKSLQMQESLLAHFPALSPHDCVLREFLRLRIAEVVRDRNAETHDREPIGESRDLLESCVANLTQLLNKPELANDQLARSSLPIARGALRDLRAALGEDSP